MTEDLYQRVLANLAKYDRRSRGPSAKDIASELDCHPNDVRRVLNTLRMEGRVSRRLMSADGAYHWTLEQRPEDPFTIKDRKEKD
jgi:predicted ArsR family transcriptional regulator